MKERLEMVFACKKCKKCFRKDVKEFEEADEFCPHCDNHFVLDAVTPKSELKVEGEDARVDSRMIRDERMKQKRQKMLDELIFDPDEDADKLG